MRDHVAGTTRVGVITVAAGMGLQDAICEYKIKIQMHYVVGFYFRLKNIYFFVLFLENL